MLSSEGNEAVKKVHVHIVGAPISVDVTDIHV